MSSQNGLRLWCRWTRHARGFSSTESSRKLGFKASVDTNESFLVGSHIRVALHDSCAEHLDRIAELVQRTNQLNFTKVRSSKEELLALLTDSDIQAGYVTAIDDFGDYGIVGFYVLRNGACIHFLFSCRVLGMGVEQYVYRELGRPTLTIVGEVVSNPERPDPYWVNATEEPIARLGVEQSVVHKHRRRTLLMKGPCDMTTMFTYVHGNGHVIQEFTYIAKNGVRVENRNHTSHIVQSLTLDESQKQRIIAALPFADDMMYSTALFDRGIDAVFLSLFTDPNCGLYRERRSGAIVAFGEYTNDLTDERKWDAIINKRCFVANCDFTESDLRTIKRDYEFFGRLTPEQVMRNLRFIREHMDKNALLVLSLGSETPYTQNVQSAYADRHLYNRELNALVHSWAATESGVAYVDVNEFITGQECFTNNINHFSRSIYYQMACKLVEILNDKSNGKYKMHSMRSGQAKGMLYRALRKFRRMAGARPMW